MQTHRVMASVACALVVLGIATPGLWAQAQPLPKTTASATVHELEGQRYISSFRSTIFLNDGYLSIHFNSINRPLRGIYKLPSQATGYAKASEELQPDISWRARDGKRFEAVRGHLVIRRSQRSLIDFLYRIDYELSFEHITKDQKKLTLHKKGSLMVDVNDVQCYELDTSNPTTSLIQAPSPTTSSPHCKLFLGFGVRYLDLRPHRHK